MLEDIKKILNISKNNSVIVMDNGEPAYVIVPFKEYSENMEIVKRKTDGGLTNCNFDSNVRDSALEDINNLIERELKFNGDIFPEIHKTEIEDGEYGDLEQNKNTKLNLKEIKLEDLPF